MKKILSLFSVAFFSMSIFGNSYWYAGEKNKVGDNWGCTAMTVSADGLYEYCDGTYNGTHSFKIRVSDTSWDGALGCNYTDKGFNNTNITNMNSSSDTWSQGDNGNIQIYNGNDNKYYIIVYYPNTTLNDTNKPKVCAATALPNENAKFFITGNDALLGSGKGWDLATLRASTTDAYDLEDLSAGVTYGVAILTDCMTWDSQKGYDQLTNTSKAKFVKNDNSIYFMLATDGNVTITYTTDPAAYTLTGDFANPTINLYGGMNKNVWSDGADFTDFGTYASHSQTFNNAGDDQYYRFYVKKLGYSFGKSGSGDYGINEGNTSASGIGDGNQPISVKISKNGDYTFKYTYEGDILEVTYPTTTAIDEAVEGKKAVKRIVNGQLVIEREGKMYNALGAEVK